MKPFISLLLGISVLLLTEIGCARKTATGAAAYPDYAGTYTFQSSDLSSAEVTVEDGKLYGKVSGQPRVELIPGENTDEFITRSVEATVRFTRNVKQVSGITIVYNGQEFSGTKQQ